MISAEKSFLRGRQMSTLADTAQSRRLWNWVVLAAWVWIWVGNAGAGAQAPTAAERARAGVGAAVKAEVPAKDLTARARAARLDGWRETIRKQLYIPARLPRLEARTWSTFSPMAGVLADRVTYATADGMVVPAIVYRPDPKTLKWKG